MRTDVYTKILLTAIAIFLGIVALRPLLAPENARAESRTTFAPLQFSESVNEFDSKNGRMVGRLAIDLRTGNVYGFPTDGNFYPRNPLKEGIVVSEPVLLGRFNIDKLVN
ncbi:MAG TPA: hypothetical protein VMT32_21185 [Bryobacteraceae bacterium]|nr:hypothetical protein [Bryobacteraceae bacterium]